MDGIFLFSKEHLIILLFFALFLSICPKLTKNLLPYSYFVEKIICCLIFLEILFEQASIFSMGDYNILNSLPIDISRFTAYVCILILLFKQYELFNVFFSWSLVCSIGEVIFFKNIEYKFPNFLYFSYLFSKCLLIYANVYLVEVRKFKINKNALKDNLLMCIIYFSFIFLLNKITDSTYCYSFSSHNIISILLFMFLTTLLYIPTLLSDNNNFNFKLKRKSK
ncbi:hypothetical protein CHF27_000770 [Romboutsia maritimum]|uniref:YwaF family protein n=1 Tax=Romboutsia maritimum TaxID=2020948 RepID=A0A371IWB4_9FIRM|nr:hypothetical protein CHF27_000770 [Romboutsia maritimum]